MKTYELKLMIQKSGRKPARLGYIDVEATCKKEALAKAHAEGMAAYERSCAITGRRDETTRIWAELA